MLFALLNLISPLLGVASNCGYNSLTPDPRCLSGPWFFPPTPAAVLTFSITSSTPDAIEYSILAVNTSWSHASASFPLNGSLFFTITFAETPPLTMPGYPNQGCTRIDWAGRSAPWCRDPASCSDPVNPFWEAGHVHLVEVSHSDIGWLGTGGDSWGPGLPDLIDDTRNIGIALDMMAVDPSYSWQHECMLFLRCFVEMFPQREAELVLRISEGRFDIGGTFSEPLESTLLNELLARQMYTGRKWFVERYPGLDSAVVAFHQDGPLRALQMPQIYAKAGMRFMKTSRWSNNIQAWSGADDASYLLSMTEVHYGQADCTVADLNARLNAAYPAYAAAGLPPQAIQALGIDYSPPINFSAFLADWEGQRAPHAGMSYSTFHAALEALDVGAPGLRRIKGERPNLWYIEGCPPHHNLCTYLRDGARSLPYAELWAAFHAITLMGNWSAYPAAQLEAAWLNLTLTDHGIAGEPTPRNFTTLPAWFINENSPPTWDLAYADKWSRAAAAGALLALNAQGSIAAAIDTAGAAPAGAAIGSFPVFNHLSWGRDGPVAVQLPNCNAASPPTIADQAGVPVPSQVIRTQGSSSGACSVIFIASGVPAMGYSTFFALPPTTTTSPLVSTAGPVAAVGSPWVSPFTNAFFTITPAVGGIASLLDLASGLEVFNTSVYKAGEWMALEYTGMGASETRSYDHAKKGSAFQKLSDFPGATWTCVESGPVRTVFATAATATGHSTATLTLEVYTTSKHLDLRLDLEAWDSAFGVANRLAFPLATHARNVTYSVPFGVVRVGTDEAENGEDDVWLTNPGPEVPLFERAWAMHPREISDWMAGEGGPGEAGLLISSSVGTFDFVDCTEAYADTAVVLAPELMLHTNSNRGPYLPEPGNHSFFFSLVPTVPTVDGGGGWQGAWRRGVEANNPLAAPHFMPTVGGVKGGAAAALPLTASLLSVGGDGGASWVTAVKKQDDGVAEARGGLIVRLFNVDGVDRDISLTLQAPNTGLKAVDAVDLIELNPRAIPITNASAFSMPLTHWAIETVCLTIL